VAYKVVAPSPKDDLRITLIAFVVLACVDFDAVNLLRWLFVVVTAE
jgi:hypothetical protein